MITIGDKSKTRGFANWSAWLKKHCQKHAKNVSTDNLELFCEKKTLRKTPNIREMTSF